MVYFKKLLAGISVCCLALSLATAQLFANGNSAATINAWNVNMRSGPGLSNGVVSLLQKGNTLTVLDQSGSWYKVSTSDNTIGWVKDSFVSLTNSADSNDSSSYGTVTGSNVNLRSDSSTASKVKGLLQKGDNLNILAQNGDWLKVSTSNGTIGWVKKDFVSTGNSRNLSSRGTTSRASSMGDEIISYAKGFLGVGYSWSGSSPSGFDCSGYTKYIYQHFGINLNRVAADQAGQGAYVSKSNLRTGDLVFFDTDGGHNYINHVGIYVGGGTFIHASSGAGKVTTSNLNEGFYANSYMTARRVF